MSTRAKRILLDVLNVLLLILLLVMIASTWIGDREMLNMPGFGWLNKLIFGDQTVTERQLIDLPVTLRYHDVMQPSDVVVSHEGLRVGARFADKEVAGTYEKMRRTLKEVLTKPPLVEALDESTFRTLLDNSVAFVYPTRLPLSLLRCWLIGSNGTKPDGQTNMLVLGKARDGTMMLAWPQEEGFFAIRTQTAYDINLDISALEKCAFAFETKEVKNFQPYDVIGAKAPALNWSQLSVPDQRNQWGRIILETMGVALQSAITFDNEAGETVVHDSTHELVVKDNGAAKYRYIGTDSEQVTNATLAGCVEWANTLLKAGAAYRGDAEVVLLDCSEQTDTITLRFAYAASGRLVYTHNDNGYTPLPAAKLVFQNGRLTEGEFSLYRFTDNNLWTLQQEELIDAGSSVGPDERLRVVMLMDETGKIMPEWVVLPKEAP